MVLPLSRRAAMKPVTVVMTPLRTCKYSVRGFLIAEFGERYLDCG